MARYLARIANKTGYKPEDARDTAKKIRELFNSKESIGHLRISSRAIEFDLFAEDARELESRESLLKSRIGEILTMKLLDLPPQAKDKLGILHEGISLFNEERYWECHEVLEQIWHPAKGAERDIIQGLILTAAALVHAQKDENDISLSMLKKALTKLGLRVEYEGIDLDAVKRTIRRMLDSGSAEAFKIEL